MLSLAWLSHYQEVGLRPAQGHNVTDATLVGWLVGLPAESRAFIASVWTPCVKTWAAALHDWFWRANEQGFDVFGVRAALVWEGIATYKLSCCLETPVTGNRSLVSKLEKQEKNIYIFSRHFAIYFCVNMCEKRSSHFHQQFFYCDIEVFHDSRGHGNAATAGCGLQEHSDAEYEPAQRWVRPATFLLGYCHWSSVLCRKAERECCKTDEQQHGPSLFCGLFFLNDNKKIYK